MANNKPYLLLPSSTNLICPTCHSVGCAREEATAMTGGGCSAEKFAVPCMEFFCSRNVFSLFSEEKLCSRSRDLYFPGHAIKSGVEVLSYSIFPRNVFCDFSEERYGVGRSRSRSESRSVIFRSCNWIGSKLIGFSVKYFLVLILRSVTESELGSVNFRRCHWIKGQNFKLIGFSTKCFFLFFSAFSEECYGVWVLVGVRNFPVMKLN